MLVITGAVAILLGMGLPTSAVYVLLSVVLAPALVKMGLRSARGAHVHLLSRMMSFLPRPSRCPPTAAAIANADLWETSVDAIRTGASGYLPPFIFALNPALYLRLTARNLYAVTTVLLSGFISPRQQKAPPARRRSPASSALPRFRVRICNRIFDRVLGTASYANLGVLAVGVGLILLFREFQPRASSLPRGLAIVRSARR
jgi:TRAP-type uncharacterized transport system fused permease subunit